MAPPIIGPLSRKAAREWGQLLPTLALRTILKLSKLLALMESIDGSLIIKISVANLFEAKVLKKNLVVGHI